jgi:transaldolase
MKATEQLHNLGQSLWLDNITRDLLNSGTLERYIGELSVTGLTSNPTIFDHAIKNSTAYDDAIREKLTQGKAGEELIFDLAIEDLIRAADFFRPVHDRTNGVDGWRMIRPAPSPPPRNFRRGRHAPICSSRYRAPRKVCRPSRRPSLRACRSM